MKNIFKLSISVFFLIISIKTYSQLSALTFVQNKGQWKGDFEFKSSYGGGAIFIEKKGFTIVQYNSEEVAGVFGHGHKKIASKDKQPDIYRADFVKDESNDSAKKSRQIHMHAYNMRFLGASAMTEFVAEKPTGEESNYFLGNDSTKWQRGIKNYLNVLQKNIYPGIDIRYYSYGGRLKYDFIVQPGADPSRILMKYDGVDGMRIKNKELVLETSLGVSKELSPYSYQIVDGTKKEVGCSYTLQGNVVRFNLDRYDGKSLLVIDPTIELATFTGSNASNWGYSAAPGPDGSLFAGGITFGPKYITTPGAYMEYFQGVLSSTGVYDTDITLTKFSSKGGKRVYSTYLGGISNEAPHSIYVNLNGEAYLMGNTYSQNDFPHKIVRGSLGSSDLFVTKFTADGSDILGSVIIGGSDNDGENINGSLEAEKGTLKLFYGDNSRSEVILDEFGNPIIAASSSSVDFPTLDAAQAIKNGKQDGVLFKFDANLTSLIFSTYIGGSEDDAAFSVAQNPISKNIYVSGVTQSKDLQQINQSNIFGNKFNSGSIDGFISVFTDKGKWLNGIFIGTPKDDFIYGIQFDQSGYPYIMGVTYGDWNVKHITPTDFEIKGTKQFISKLNMELTEFVYSTVFGAPGVTIPTLVPVAFMVDRCENVYLSGWGDAKWCTPNDQPGTRNFPRKVTTGPYISTIEESDGGDFYFFALQKDGASQLYGEFFGQYGGETDHVDGGTSRFDKNGVIYQAICANCFWNSCSEEAGPQYEIRINYPRSTIGRGKGECNLFAVKIDFQLSGVAAGIKTSIDGVFYDTSGCAPLSVQFSDTIGIAKTYEWDFDDGTPPVVDTTSSQSHTFQYRPTPYHVKLTASDPDRLCQPIDLKFVDIITGTDKVTLKAEATRNVCTSSTFTFTNTSTSASGKPFALNSFIWNWGDGSPLETTNFGNVPHTFPSSQGTYKVYMRLNDGSFCNNQDSIPILVNLSGIVKASIDGPKLGCIDETTGSYLGTFKSVGQGGQFFEWFLDGESIGGLTPSKTVFEFPFTDVKNYEIKLLVFDPSACIDKQKDSAFFSFSIKESPIAYFRYDPYPSQENTPTIFENKSSGADAAQPYKWYFGDGVQSEDESPTHLYNYTNKYEVTLIAKNQYGCTASHIDSVSAIVFPLVDVPNAFIPNSSGLNRTINVQGFGITKMDFRIYNRWGQLMFASSSQDFGWDGKYKGVLQPMDVYAYTLQVKFSDGTQVSKKGDITLIR